MFYELYDCNNLHRCHFLVVDYKVIMIVRLNDRLEAMTSSQSYYKVQTQTKLSSANRMVSQTLY